MSFTAAMDIWNTHYFTNINTHCRIASKHQVNFSDVMSTRQYVPHLVNKRYDTFNTSLNNSV